MKETGLMFKAPLVRAILSGQKTQTRRIATNPFAYNPPRCPWGRKGDLIYVRETWAEVPRHQPQTDEDLPMRKDGRILVYQADPEWDGSRNFLCADGCMRWVKPDRWRPSIHMPKEFARIWLEVTGVRVERLQSISRADAIAEGIQFFNSDHECGAKNYLDKTDMDYSLCPTDSFETLWKSTGGDWSANPWVWAIDFKTISTTGRPA